MNFALRSSPVKTSWVPKPNNWTKEAVEDLKKMHQQWPRSRTSIGWKQHKLFERFPAIGWVLFPEREVMIEREQTRMYLGDPPTTTDFI